MLGSIIGDIVGAVYEFDNFRHTDFEPFFHPNAFFTDDTVCTIAVADALTSMGKGAAWALKDWGRRYWHIGGWGARFGDWLQSDSYRPYGSYGNGAAMRVSPAGLLGQTLKETISYARWVTEVTHDHPEGLKGAEATAVAIFFAKQGSDPAMIRKEIESRYGYDLSTPIDVIRQSYGATRVGSICHHTRVQVTESMDYSLPRASLPLRSGSCGKSKALHEKCDLGSGDAKSGSVSSSSHFNGRVRSNSFSLHRAF